MWDLSKTLNPFYLEKNFDISCLNLTLGWFEDTINDWLKILFLIEDKNGKDMMAVIRDYNESNKHSPKVSSSATLKNNSNELKNTNTLGSANIRNFIINTYIFCRMRQLFDIIIDYPYSEPVLQDLHECIKLDPFYREKFTHSLKNAFEVRLLHAGVPTCDILEAYITAIKALKLLDPQGIILKIVCDPVRNYLRSREDTIRCIISFLTNDTLSDLDENKNNSISKKAPEIDDDMNDDACKSTKLTSNSGGVPKLNKDPNQADIISMLINIFDSKDLFVQEYQRILAQKLILNTDINYELEFRNLELLSLRFGESELHNCEVMLKDIKDSERINQRINSGEIEGHKLTLFEANGLILSQQFWPENLSFTANDLKNFKLPEGIQETFDDYTKSFETIKANRTLNWLHQLGTVKLELEFSDRKQQEFVVRPIQAAIIYQFQLQSSWKISLLAKELNLLPSALRKHLIFWKNHGILKDGSEEDTFELDEEGQRYSKQTSRSSFSAQELDIYMDEEQINDSKDDNKLQIFWNFIDNMLKNLHALSLDRIYSMLKMFNMQSPEIENLTMHELRQFLDRKVYERKLTYVNGVYDLHHDSSS